MTPNGMEWYALKKKKPRLLSETRAYGQKKNRALPG
jgi:hypothetical protein